MIVGTFADSQLLPEVQEGIKAVGGVEFLVVFSVTSLHLPVVPWGIGLNEFGANAKLF